MESKQIFDDAYKQLDSIQKANRTSRVTIDYSKLDTESASIIRQTLADVVTKRKSEVYRVIAGVQ